MHNDVMNDVSDDECTCYHMPGLNCCNLHLRLLQMCKGAVQIVTKGLCRLLKPFIAFIDDLFATTHKSSICVPSLPRSLICLGFHPNRRF